MCEDQQHSPSLHNRRPSRLFLEVRRSEQRIFMWLLTFDFPHRQFCRDRQIPTIPHPPLPSPRALLLRCLLPCSYHRRPNRTVHTHCSSPVSSTAGFRCLRVDFIRRRFFPLISRQKMGLASIRPPCDQWLLCHRASHREPRVIRRKTKTRCRDVFAFIDRCAQGLHSGFN